MRMLVRGLAVALPVAAVVATATPASAVCIFPPNPLHVCGPCEVVNSVGREAGVQLVCFA